MKRLIAISLMACMVLSFAGCSDSSEESESSGKVSIVTESSADESSEEESSEPESSVEVSSEEESSEQESSKEESSEPESSVEESSEEESSEPESSEEPSVAEDSIAPESSEEPSVEPSPEPSPEPSEEPVQQTAMGEFSEADMKFLYNNNLIGIHDNMANVVSAIGNASSVESAPSCLAINVADDKMYYYNGFMIQTYTDNEAEKVYMIQITDSSAATAKGVTVGSSAADIENAYGLAAASEHSDFIYSYNADSQTHLDFIMEDGKVIEIDYTYDVN